VTKSYYAAQHTVLQVPSAQTLLAAEAIRAPLLVLAILPLVLTTSLTRRQLAICSAAVLFIIGGVVPLLHQAGALPGLEADDLVALDLQLDAALLAAKAAVRFDQPVGRMAGFVPPSAGRHVIQVRPVEFNQPFNRQRKLSHDVLLSP
jgi:hypothetical protein